MRCIRSVKALRALENSDLESIAIYTDVDRDAPFVRHADHAIRLEAPNGPVAAYLDHDRLIALLVRAGADAVWPGWGFVAEDPDFADRVTDSVKVHHQIFDSGIPFIQKPFTSDALITKVREVLTHTK